MVLRKFSLVYEGSRVDQIHDKTNYGQADKDVNPSSDRVPCPALLHTISLFAADSNDRMVSSKDS